MAAPLFSTFRTGENRVTASTMAVFERIDLALVLELLEKAIESSGTLSGVQFENQVPGQGSVPDARIAARFSWLLETKTERGAYGTESHGRKQLRAHARLLEQDPDAQLFVLTPDPEEPQWFGELDGISPSVAARVRWFSFSRLGRAIEDVLNEPDRVLAEQARFLLSELKNFYEMEGLLSNDDVVVVAARVAWSNYLDFHAYICQPGRSFRSGLHYLGFYHAGRIEPTVPMILARFSDELATVESTERLAARGATGALAAQSLRRAVELGTHAGGGSFDVFVLTAPDDVRTLRLSSAIVNDTKTSSGRPWAWTLGQRYTSSRRLTSGVTSTTQLDEGVLAAH